MSKPEQLIIDTATRLFEDMADPQTVNNEDELNWREPLWTELEALGLTRTWVCETYGGAGAGVLNGFEVLRAAGKFAVSLPLAETLMAGWLLEQAGLQLPPSGAMTIASGVSVRLNGDTLAGRADAVPFARDCQYLVVVIPSGVARSAQVVLAAVANCTIVHGENLAGEARDSVDLTGAHPVCVGELPLGIRAQLDAVGAVARSMQMAGALHALLDISVQYAAERVAFERPIGKFQAIQHNLARLAGEFAAANAAANSAAYSLSDISSSEQALFIEIASAKVRTGQAAHEGAMIAHQVHGAIGFTREHVLHRFSHRLWSWRDEYGDENTWASRLGATFATAGADQMWPTLTAI